MVSGFGEIHADDDTIVGGTLLGHGCSPEADVSA
jgi:hypothetical protein